MAQSILHEPVPNTIGVDAVIFVRVKYQFQNRLREVGDTLHVRYVDLSIHKGTSTLGAWYRVRNTYCGMILKANSECVCGNMPHRNGVIQDTVITEKFRNEYCTALSKVISILEKESKLL